MNFNVVINTDDNYLQHAMAMLCSLYENNREHSITVHVLHKNLSKIAKKYLIELSKRYENRLLFYSVEDSVLEGVQFRKKRPLSMAAYYRLLLSSVLPQNLDKVLYLDCDMIVMRDIQEIFKIEIDNYALAATIDKFPYTEKHRLQLHMEVGERTFCSGIMLVNLKYWRDHNVEPRLLEYAKRYKEEVYLHDQDVLNYYFKKKWFLLPPKWNHIAGTLRVAPRIEFKSFDYMAFSKEPMIYHYASVRIKPWYAVPVPDKKLYVKYLTKSGFSEIKFEKKPLSVKTKMMILTLKYDIKRMIQKLLLRCRWTAQFAVGGVNLKRKVFTLVISERNSKKDPWYRGYSVSATTLYVEHKYAA